MVSRAGPWQTTAVVIIAGCIITLLSFGPRSALGLFLTPMTETRGWGREIFAFAIALQNIIWGAGQPAFGAIADRYGTARVLALGGFIYGSGLIVTAWAPDPLWLNVGAGLLIGLGTAAASFSIVLAAFGRTVSPQRRSIAFGIGTAAGSFGQFLFAPLGQGLIESIGWQQALYVMAAMMLIVPALAFALKGKPDTPAAGMGGDQTMRQALAEAFGYRSFVLLVAGFFVCGFHVAFITTHLPPYITDVGLDPALGAWSIAIIGLFNIVGSLASGAISGHYSKPVFLSLIYFSRAVVIALFITLPPSPTTVLLFAGSIGLLWLSTVPPTSGLVAVMFGPRYMATLFGFVFFSHQAGAFLGVWLGGRLYDQYHSYTVVWWLAVALGIFAAIVHWPIREQPVERLAGEVA
jgi:MFS family permease